MITVLRNYFKKSSQVVLWVIIAAFVIGLMPVAFRQMAGSVWAMRVNGEEIGYQEYLLEYQRAKERMLAIRQQYGEYADWLLEMMGIQNPQTLAVQSLAKQELLNQFADAIGLQISPEYVIQKMSDPVYVTRQLGDVIPPQIVDPMTGIDQVMLKRYLKHFGLSVEMFERIIERTLTDRFATDIIISSMYLPKFDVKQKYITEYAKKSFSILVLPLKKMLEQEKKNEITPEALKTFYDAQGQRYWVPEKRSGQMWEFDPKSYDIAVTNDQVEEYYENNKVKLFIETPSRVQVRRILFAVTDDAQLIPMQQRAEQVRQDLLRDPSQFEVVATRISDDTNTSQNGGLMEPFVRGTYDVTFDRTAFLLKEEDEISQVVQTKDGYEILQRISKTPQTFKSFSSAKNEIRDTLKQQEFKAQFTNDMKKVIDQAETLEALILQKGGKPKELERLSLDDTPLSQYLFKLQPGRRTFFIDGEKGVALRLDKVYERYLPMLDSMKETVTSNLQEERAREKLKEMLQEAKNSLKTMAFADVKKQFDADSVLIGPVDPQDKDEIDLLKKEGIPIQRMLQMEKPGAMITDMAEERGFVVRLDDIEPLNEQEFQTKVAQVAQALESERTQQYMEGFVASLYRNAKIETNESVVTLES